MLDAIEINGRGVESAIAELERCYFSDLLGHRFSQNKCSLRRILLKDQFLPIGNKHGGLRSGETAACELYSFQDSLWHDRGE
jgi:hypothetical protein